MLEESEIDSASHRRPSFPRPPVQVHVYASTEALVNGFDPGVKWTQSSIGGTNAHVTIDPLVTPSGHVLHVSMTLEVGVAAMFASGAEGAHILPL